MRRYERPRIVRRVLVASLAGTLALGGLAGVSAAASESSESYVQQVNTEARTDGEAIERSNTGTTGIGLINDSIPAGLLDDVTQGFGHQSGVVAVQSGNRNRARIAVWGAGNAVSLRQVGSDLVSLLDVVGHQNRVRVDQEGSRLTSDVKVIGSDTQFVHIQRGDNIQGIPVTITENSEARFIFDIRRSDGTYGRVSFDASGKRLQDTATTTPTVK